jgi:2-deoxy-D-gluconate 3-dehydrogenase
MEYPNFSIEGHVAIVTGASKGIGFGLAKAYANAGAKVAVCARDVASLEKLVGEIKAEGHEAKAYLLDVANVASIEPTIQQIYKDFGRLDILMNNAGMGDNHPAVAVKESDWDPMFNVNAKGLFFVAQAAGKIMLERNYGRIVNMSSQASVVGIRDHAVYCATKGAVNQLTKVLALEWAPRGVTVNAIGPTFIYTPGTAERLDNPEYRAGVVARIPAGKVGSIADVAAAAIFLSTPSSGLITGQHLAIDGGWTAQ